MPFLALLPYLGAAGAGVWLHSEWDSITGSTQSSPSTAGGVPQPTGTPSTFTLVTYAAMGLGLYWLYRKAKHA